MGRFLSGVAAALLLVAAGVFIWRAQAVPGTQLPDAPKLTAATSASAVDFRDPPQATERTREERRFARYDRDKNGAVGRDEYLSSRQKAFARLDVNGDGRLGFDEYAVKTVAKFGGADRNRNGALDAGEFATTRVVRKAAARRDCPPTPRLPDEDDS